MKSNNMKSIFVGYFVMISYDKIFQRATVAGFGGIYADLP